MKRLGSLGLFCGAGFVFAIARAGSAAEPEGAIPLDRAGFTVAVARRLNEAGLPRPVTIVRLLRLASHAADGVTSISVNLDHAYKGCVAIPKRCPDVLRNVVLGAVTLTRAPYSVPPAGVLRAFARPASYIKANAIFWGLVTEVSTQDAPPGMAAVLFADEADVMRTISTRDLQVMHLDVMAAYAAALHNMALELEPIDHVLRRLPPRQINLLDASPYESSRLLMHEDWARLSASWKGHLLVAAPAADRVLFADGSDAQARGAMAVEARAGFNRAERGISPDVFEWHRTGWGRMSTLGTGSGIGPLIDPWPAGAGH